MDDLRYYILFNSILSFQDDGQIIMKACVCYGTQFLIEKIPTSDLEPLDELPGLLGSNSSVTGMLHLKIILHCTIVP